MNPYAPIFSVMAASTTEPPVGASGCASGSHVCTGHIGTLTANAVKKAMKMSTCVLSDSGNWNQSSSAKAARLLVEVDERDQHQQRAQQRVQEELDRRVDAPLAAPDPDDEVHRDQHRLEEHVEQDRVERCERAVDEPRHDQERRVVLRDAHLDHFPARPHDQHRDEAVQDDEEHRNAVDAQVVEDVEIRNPFPALDELHRRCRLVEMRVQRDRDQEAGQRPGQRGPARLPRILVASQHEHGDARDDGHPDGERQVRRHG